MLDLGSLTHAALGVDRSSISGGEVRIDEIQLQAVPEPATLGLLTVGGLFMLGRRKRTA
ncbi:MAG: PEP-CTERM sorting domain-containing protein [Phycisphaeraceae bacterium]